ncbi:MAG: gamma-glutamylcyclotransferase [Methylocystaceae bacterium]|nr:MAG: gamma-glutamylcyclotransferase [Methylocystaceae bacterium]
MPLYFAYGANMDVAAMTTRCPKSRPLGLARLAGRRFIVMEAGYASVVRDTRTFVHGLLWDLALSDTPALDRYEEVSHGLYRKAVLPVSRRPAGFVQALIYIGSSAREGAPKSGYLENVIASARALGLPALYISHLESLLPTRC